MLLVLQVGGLAAPPPEKVAVNVVVEAILHDRTLPGGERPSEYLRRTEDDAVRKAIAEAFTSAAYDAALPEAGNQERFTRRLRLARALADAGEDDLLKQLMTGPAASPQDVLNSLIYAEQGLVGLSYLHYLEAVTSTDKGKAALQSLAPEKRTEWERRLSDWKRLHFAYEVILAEGRAHPEDAGRELAAALLKEDGTFKGLPTYVWIRTHGLSPNVRSILLADYQTLAPLADAESKANPRVFRLIKALVAGKAHSELEQICRGDGLSEESAHGLIELVYTMCPDEFTVAMMSTLAKNKTVRGEAESLVGGIRAAISQWRSAQIVLTANPKDIAALRSKTMWYELMAKESDLFGDATTANASRKEAVKILDFILVCGDYDALMRRMRLNESLGNYREAIADLDRLIMTIPEGQVGQRDDFLKRRQGLEVKAANAAANH